MIELMTSLIIMGFGSYCIGAAIYGYPMFKLYISLEEENPTQLMLLALGCVGVLLVYSGVSTFNRLIGAL